jgi:hypothetical protein
VTDFSTVRFQIGGDEKREKERAGGVWRIFELPL